MENRLGRARDVLNALVDQNEGSPYHSGKGRFRNLSRDVFVNGPVAGRIPIEVGKPAILSVVVEEMLQMGLVSNILWGVPIP